MRLINANDIPWDMEGVGFIPVVTKEEIDNMPTIEAEPVVHAWIIKPIPFGYCSHCGELLDSRSGFNFCPYCGAKLDGRKEE